MRSHRSLSSAKVLWEREAIGLAKFSGAIVQVREGPHGYLGYSDKQGEVTLLPEGAVTSHPAASYGCCITFPPGNESSHRSKVATSECPGGAVRGAGDGRNLHLRETGAGVSSTGW